jgi:hypothetical protein
MHAAFAAWLVYFLMNGHSLIDSGRAASCADRVETSL